MLIYPPPRSVKIIICLSRNDSKSLINEVMNNGLMIGIKSNPRAFLYFSLRDNITYVVSNFLSNI